MAPKKIVFVVTSHDKFANGDPTGWWLSEFAHPYALLSDHADITVASPAGGRAPLDPTSVKAAQDSDDTVSQTFLEKQTSLWENTVQLSTIKGHASEYDAIFFVGGHGPMFDLAKDETSHAIVREFFAADKVIAAVCHGPAALANVMLEDGRPYLEGHLVTGFSDSEERAVGVEVPFSLEQRLNVASGGGYVKTKDWDSKVEVGRHGKLITGQNPASASAVGSEIYKALFGEELKSAK